MCGGSSSGKSIPIPFLLDSSSQKYGTVLTHDYLRLILLGTQVRKGGKDEGGNGGKRQLQRELSSLFALLFLCVQRWPFLN